MKRAIVLWLVFSKTLHASKCGVPASSSESLHTMRFAIYLPMTSVVSSTLIQILLLPMSRRILSIA
jgi:hypothetical protein